MPSSSSYPPIVDEDNSQDGTVVVTRIQGDDGSESQIMGIKHNNPNHKFITNYF